MMTDLVSYSFQTWISALFGAAIVGSIGFLPTFIVPNEQTKSSFIIEFMFSFNRDFFF